jgi:hypothetical protein
VSRIMYDGVAGDAAAIGVQAKPGDLVAGYGDGLYAWSDADWAHILPGVIRRVIVVRPGSNAGHILDCEPGNCTPAQSVDWTVMRRASGLVRPAVYCNQKNIAYGWPAVRAAFQARGVPEPDYWVANYDGNPVIPAGAIGKQYADDQLLGKPWDLSVVADGWPDTAPSPQPTSKPTMEDDMSITSNAGRAGLSWAAGTKHVVQVTYDPHGGDPKLRVVLALTTGPFVMPDAWQLAQGSGTLQIPEEHMAACRGVILEGAPAPVYDAVAV